MMELGQVEKLKVGRSKMDFVYRATTKEKMTHFTAETILSLFGVALAGIDYGWLAWSWIYREVVACWGWVVAVGGRWVWEEKGKGFIYFIFVLFIFNRN